MVLLFGFVEMGAVHGQIGLSPTIVFIAEQDPITRITLRNNSDKPQEVSLNAVFGYPMSDSLGQLQMIYDDERQEMERSLIPHLRVYPRQFVMEPGAMQNVRLEVSEMGQRPHGLYWTRLHITSGDISTDPEQQVRESIGTKISYRIRQDIGVHYLHGQVSTLVEVDQISTRRVRDADRDDLVMELRLRSGGNSPFIGSMQVRVLDPSGAEVRVGDWMFSVYGQRYWVQPLALGGLPQGRYRMEFTFQTQRGDVASSVLPAARTQIRTLDIDL
jgi:hypothetical protein